jgi:prevent-host-death family protein
VEGVRRHNDRRRLREAGPSAPTTENTDAPPANPLFPANAGTQAFSEAHLAKIAILTIIAELEILMPASRVTASEFQNAFGMLSDKARHEPVVITKHGRDSLVVMPVEEWERLKRRDRQVGLTSELSDEWVDAIRGAAVPAEFAHLDAELK